MKARDTEGICQCAANRKKEQVVKKPRARFRGRWNEPESWIFDSAQRENCHDTQARPHQSSENGERNMRRGLAVDTVEESAQIDRAQHRQER